MKTQNKNKKNERKENKYITFKGGGEQKMSFAMRNITQYPPLNKDKLALTPLQIFQMTHPPPPTTTYKYYGVVAR